MRSDLDCPLFDYPAQTAFETVLPKSKIYAHAKPTRRQQRLITDEVAQIVWKYKLAPETVRLPARNGIVEIQVFSVELKEAAKDGLTIDVLRCIDKAIDFPIFFEILSDKRVRAVAAYKRPSEANADKWVVGDYFMSPWFPIDTPRSTLPVALDLASLYNQIIRRLMPHSPREGESLKDHVERISRIQSLEHHLRKLETLLNREAQFNRKVEINGKMRALQSQLNELTIC